MLLITGRGEREPQIVEPAPGFYIPAGAIWLDFVNPTREEEVALEAALGLSLPTREEMAEIETSSRLYRENGALFMTAELLVNSQGEAPMIGPVTFVLAGERLITIRYLEPNAFKVVYERIGKGQAGYGAGREVFIALLDEIIDRLADVIERSVTAAESLSERIFTQTARTDFRALIRKLGRIQRLNAKARESAASLTRVMNFCDATRELQKIDELEVMQRDLASIIDHSGYLAANVTFLLDAALGMINIEQNAIIKIFSIGAVIFLPPTLIASYFGMNFRHMRIFDQPWGEPVAFVAMLASVIAALWWFRRRGWF